MFVFTQRLPVSSCHVRRETISRIREHAEGSKSQRLPNNFCFWSQVCSVLGRFERQGIETCSLSRNAHRWFFPATFPRHWRELLRAKIRRIIIKFYRGKSDQRKSRCIKGYVIKVIYFPVYPALHSEHVEGRAIVHLLLRLSLLWLTRQHIRIRASIRQSSFPLGLFFLLLH